MNARKQRVIQQAYHLFVEKGVQATSIQDLIDACGISKGTFYNYFSSKNELLIGVCKHLFGVIEEERNELLIGQDRSDIEIFIRQMELQMQENRAKKLMKLLDEMFHIDDAEIRQFLHQSQLRLVRWVYSRFIDIFGEQRKPVLLDCSIMFMGMLNYTLRYNEQYNRFLDIGRIVRYCVMRIGRVVEDAADSGEQLMSPDLLENKEAAAFRHNVRQLIARIRTRAEALEREQGDKICELIDFAEEELLRSGSPRFHVLECTLNSLRPEVPADLKGPMDRLLEQVRDLRRTCEK